MLSPSLGSRSPSRKLGSWTARYWKWRHHVHPKNVDKYSPVDEVQHRRRLQASSAPLRWPQILHPSKGIRVILGVQMDGQR